MKTTLGDVATDPVYASVQNVSKMLVMLLYIGAEHSDTPQNAVYHALRSASRMLDNAASELARRRKPNEPTSKSPDRK